MKKRAVAIAALFATLALGNSLHAEPAKKPAISGESTFKSHCAQCHPGGTNMLKPSKPVAESAQLATLATFQSYLKSPVGHMPYYKHLITDKKTLDALYKYCKTLKRVHARPS